MSTISKLDSIVRQRRAARRNLLRNPPYKADPKIMAELSLISRSSHLTGETKHELFTRGAAQLAATL